MKELKHFEIGESYGSNQDWFEDPWMNRGGCGAVTACDSCIYLAKYRNMRSLYPYDPNHVTKEDFVNFALTMKPFLSPRMHGINKTETFMDGFRDYLATCKDVTLRMCSLEGTEDFETAKNAIRSQIDRNYPVPYLMLLHTDEIFEDYNWHWFLVNGYDETPESFRIKAVTYGKGEWLNFAQLWNTGHEQKGGLVLYSESL